MPMIETFEELQKEYPRTVKDMIDRGFTERKILKIYKNEYLEKAYFQGKVNQVTIREE